MCRWIRAVTQRRLYAVELAALERVARKRDEAVAAYQRAGIPPPEDQQQQIEEEFQAPKTIFAPTMSPAKESKRAPLTAASATSRAEKELTTACTEWAVQREMLQPDIDLLHLHAMRDVRLVDLKDIRDMTSWPIEVRLPHQLLFPPSHPLLYFHSVQQSFLL